MTPLISLTRVLTFAFRNFWRNIWLSLVTIFILFLTLFSITFSLSLNLIAGQAITAVKQRVQVSVYFTPDALEEDVKEVQQAFASMPEVQAITYISREEALAAFKEGTSDNPVVQETLDVLGDNPLGATLVVKAYNIDDYPKILKTLESPDFAQIVQERDFEENQSVVNKLTSITERVKTIGIVVSAVFSLIAFLVMFNTIRVTIYTYREEIGVMKLVGASNCFVRAPFVIEMVLYAVLASILAIVVTSLLIGVSAPYLDEFFTGYDFNLVTYYQSHLFSFVAAPFLAGLVLAFLSSLIGVGRFLRR